MAGLFGSSAFAPALIDTSGPEPTLTRQGRIMAAAAALKGDVGTAMQLKMLPQSFARQQQFGNYLSGLMQPTYTDTPPLQVRSPDEIAAGVPESQVTLPQRTSNGATIADPRVAQAAIAAPMYGYNIDPFLKVLEANQPAVKYDRGFGFNEKTGQPMGGFHPDLGQGVMPTAGGGAVAVPGYSDAAAQIAGATENAKEAAKAGYNLVPVPMGGGKTQLMPASIAAPLLAAAAARQAGGPGQAGPSGDAGGFGIAPSPDEQALATERAKTQAEREAGMQGARNAMQQVDDQTNMIAQNLHDMLGETQDPQTGKWVKTKPSMIGGLSTGSQTDLIEHIPFLNQSAKDLEAKIETVRNGTSFNSMQAIKNAMAAAGDGGTASMRMTDQTARMLGEINGSLNQNQSGPQFEATVRRHLAQLDALNKARHDLFESQYNGVKTPTPGQTRPTANYKANYPAAPMSVNQRQAGSTYITPRGPMKWTGTGWLPAS